MVDDEIALGRRLHAAHPGAPLVLLGDSALWASRFADHNKPFGGPTGFEWLSRDAEVQRYVSDPLCGFAFTNELARDIFVAGAQ